MVMEAPPFPQSVGREFVKQYYTLLHDNPTYLHRFYNNQSSFTHGALGASNRDTIPMVGQKQIHQKIQQLNFQDCHAKITQVDSQSTLDNGVVIQVTGELSNAGQPMRRFTQTFVLAAQSPKKYYVHNDIFRYQDEIYTDEGDQESVRSEPENDLPTSERGGHPGIDDIQQQSSIQQQQQQAGMTTYYTGSSIQSQPMQVPAPPHHQGPIPGTGGVLPQHASQPASQSPTVNGSIHPDEYIQQQQMVQTPQQIPAVAAQHITVPPPTTVPMQPVVQQPPVLPQPILQPAQPVQQIQQVSATQVVSTTVPSTQPPPTSLSLIDQMSSPTQQTQAILPQVTTNVVTPTTTISNAPPVVPQSTIKPTQSANNNTTVDEIVQNTENLEIRGGDDKEQQQKEKEHSSTGQNNIDETVTHQEPVPQVNEPITYANRLKIGGGSSNGPNYSLTQNSPKSVVSPPSSLHRGENRDSMSGSNSMLNNSSNSRNQMRNRGGPMGGGSRSGPGRDNRPGRNSFSEDDDRRRGIGSNYNDSHQLFLGHLPLSATEEVLKKVFQRFGEIAELRINNKPTSKGMNNTRMGNYGFITFETYSAVQACLHARPISYYDDVNNEKVELNVEEKKNKYSGGGGNSGSNRPPPGGGNQDNMGGRSSGGNNNMNRSDRGQQSNGGRMSGGNGPPPRGGSGGNRNNFSDNRGGNRNSMGGGGGSGGQSGGSSNRGGNSFSRR